MLVAAAGAGILATALAFKLMLVPVLAVVAAVKLLVAGLALVVSPVGVIAVSVGALVVVFLRATRAGQQMAATIRRHLADVGKAFRDIGDIFAETFGGIVAAVQKGELQLAWDIALAGLKAGWLTFVMLLREKWHEFANFFEDAFRDAILTVQKIGVAVATGLRLGFLDVVLTVIDAANKAHRKMLELTGGLPEEKAIRAKAEAELPNIGRDNDREVAIVAGEQRKINVIRERQDARRKAVDLGLPLGELVKEAERVERLNAQDDETIAALERNIELSKKRQMELATLWSDVWEKHSIGEKFIDPTPFRAARKMVSDEGNQILKDLESFDRRERELRDAHQHWKIEAVRRERDEYLAELRRLNELANREVGPMPREWNPTLGAFFSPWGSGRSDLAPMPRERPAADRFGDAARGLFQSADFRGALSIGPPAKLEEIGREQVGLLREIRDKIEPGVFT
jgi:hypothetical protein